MRQISILFFFCFSFSVVQSQNIELIGKYYSEKDFDKVIEVGIAEISKYPDNPDINMLVGRAYADKKQYQKAISFLEKGTTKKNNKNFVQAWSHGYLGKCYYVLDNYQKSKENFQACLKLQATENSYNFAKKHAANLQMTRFYNKWQIVETENIRFHFQKPSNIKDINQFIKERQDAYIELNKFFNAKPYKKIDFYVWDKPKQAARKFKMELGFAIADLCIINSRNNQTIGHEISHILHAYGFYPKNKTRLIHEGVASYFDLTKRDRFALAKQLLAGKEIDIIHLWEKPSEFPENYFYTIGPALISFLLEKGSTDQLKELLKDESISNARTVYSDFDKIMEEFSERLKQ